MPDSAAGYQIPPTRPWQGITDPDGDGTFTVVQSGTGYPPPEPPEAVVEEPAPAPPPDQPDQ